MNINWIENKLSCILRVVIMVASTAKLPQIMDLLRRAQWRARLGGLGDGCHLHSHIIIHSPKSVVVGNHVNIAEFVHIWGGGGVSIGSRVLIASHCTITSQTHNVDLPTRHKNVIDPVQIGDDAWIGSGSIILPGITIGKNSVIGAGSVVTRNIPDNSLAMGVPAKVCSPIE